MRSDFFLAAATFEVSVLAESARTRDDVSGLVEADAALRGCGGAGLGPVADADVSTLARDDVSGLVEEYAALRGCNGAGLAPFADAEVSCGTWALPTDGTDCCAGAAPAQSTQVASRSVALTIDRGCMLWSG